eukprot:Ihof_evm3s79 gene=Ihof_evmTU3s79
MHPNEPPGEADQAGSDSLNLDKACTMFIVGLTVCVVVVLTFLGYRRLFKVLAGGIEDEFPWTKIGTSTTEIVKEDEASAEGMRKKLEKAREAYKHTERSTNDAKEVSMAVVRWAMVALVHYQYTVNETNDARKAVRAGFISHVLAAQYEVNYELANEEMKNVSMAAAAIRPGWEQTVFQDANRMLQIDMQRKQQQMEAEHKKQALEEANRKKELKLKMEKQEKELATKNAEKIAKELL